MSHTPQETVTKQQPITKETTMPPRLIVRRPGTGLAVGQMMVLDQAQMQLGRESGCDVFFDEAGVSRRHAVIGRGSDGQWSVADLQSTNGTWVNGRRVAQCRLKDGDELRLGPNVVVTFSWAAQPAGALDQAVVAAQVTLFSVDLTNFEFTWSEAFDRMLDVPAGTLSGAPLRMEALVAQEDCARLRAALTLAERGTPMDIEIRTTVGRRHLELRGERAPGEPARITGSAWDITARYRQTQSLRRHAALFESFSDAMALLDLEGRVLDCNTATLRLFGAAKEVLVGQTLDGPGHQGWTAMALDKVRRLGRFEDERRQGAAGAEITCEVVVTPLLDEQGVPQGFVVVYRDVTETRALQSRLVMADRLTAMGTLAAGVAHEINNPLAYLRANLSHVLAAAKDFRPQDDDDVVESIKDCAEGVERIARIVRDLKFFSHQGTGEVAPTDVAKAIRVACKMAEPVMRHRARLSLTVGEVPLVKAEEARLAQVVLNLLINAAQAMPEEARAQENQIALHVSPEAGGVLIEVTDNGSGMTAEVLRRVFDPFFTTKPTGVGSGLGLAICHGIIESFGGSISAKSTPGLGTTFRVWLGAAVEAANDLPAQAVVVDETPALRVLVVDDESRVVKALTRMLGSSHQVTCAHGAQEALAAVRNGGAWDVVLCDVMMPAMNGLELHRALSAERPDLAERFIFMTGGGFSPRVQQELDRTGRAMLDKPLDSARLFELLQARSKRQVHTETVRFALVS